MSGALAAQLGLGAERWPGEAEVKVRMGLHTGEPTLGEEGYLGLDVVRGARIASAAHGGQVLVSETTHALLPADLPGGAKIIDLGQHSLKDLERAEHLFQIVGPGFAQTSRRRAPTRPVGTRKTSSDGSTNLLTAASRPCSRGLILEKMESGRWLLKRRDDRTT